MIDICNKFYDKNASTEKLQKLRDDEWEKYDKAWHKLTEDERKQCAAWLQELTNIILRRTDPDYKPPVIFLPTVTYTIYGKNVDVKPKKRELIDLPEFKVVEESEYSDFLRA